MDFPKAFDCIDHDILLRKMHFYGIWGLPYNWFVSYLHERKQFVNANNINSSIRFVSHGVPQGSILGPLLFLIFINDFPEINPFFKFCIFADDSTLTCKFDTSDETVIKNRIEDELLIVHRWLVMNKIKVNYTKSKFIIFSYGKIFSLDTIVLGHNSIRSTDDIKFLGIYVDKHLTFRSHVNSICNKVSKIVGLLFRLNNILPIEALKTLYTSLLIPHLLYGIEIWYGIHQYNNDRVFKLQKKAIRAINCLSYNSHTNDYFKSMQFLKLEDMYKQRALLFIFNSTSILTHEDIHNYNTRYSNNIVLPQFYRTKTQSTIFYKGINLWNDLPQDIKDLRYRGAFKNSLKLLFLNEY